MFVVNEYFYGKVMSLSFKAATGRATVGVMAPGEFEFGTSTKEIITVVSGEMEALLPGKSTWEIFKPFKTFVVPAGVRFKVRMQSETAYLCLYE